MQGYAVPDGDNGAHGAGASPKCHQEPDCLWNKYNHPTGRLRDKSRRVLEIAELDGIVDGEIVLNTLYQFEEISEKDGRVIGELVQKGKLKSRTKLEAAGMRDIDGL